MLDRAVAAATAATVTIALFTVLMWLLGATLARKKSQTAAVAALKNTAALMQTKYFLAAKFFAGLTIGLFIVSKIGD
jgi:hypothetical protein